MSKKEIFAVSGMTCAACVAHVERAAAGVLGDGVPFAVSLLSATLSITLPDGADVEPYFKKLSVALRHAGYGLEKKGETGAELRAAREKKRERARLITSVVLTAVLMIVAMWHMIPNAPQWPLLDGNRTPIAHWSVQAVLTGIVLFLERRFFKGGFSALWHRTPNMDTLVALGAASAAVYGLVAGGCIIYGTATANTTLVHEYLHRLYMESAATILTLVSVGKFLEGRARHKTASAVRALMSQEAPVARRIGENGEEAVLPEELRVGDLCLVPAGEKIPADSTVVSGEGSVNEAMITGESMPRTVQAGDAVIGATVLEEGTLTVRIDRIGEESTLRRMIALLEETAATKAPVARLADQVSGIFVPVVLGIAALTAIVWLILSACVPSIAATMAFQTAVSVLVISCPCALGLATPTAITAGSGRGAAFGILFKSAAALETLAKVEYLLTDKTGTLTRGEMQVTDTVFFTEEKEEALALLASIEALSAHPIARPMTALCAKRLPLFEYKAHLGRGLSALDGEGRLVLAGRVALLELFSKENCLNHEQKAQIASLEGEGKSVTLLVRDDALLCMIAVADTLRADSAAAVKQLRQAGVHVVMLTGDNAATAAKIAAEAGITEYHAALLPEDKARLVASYAERGVSAMLGDGINDAPALACADVGLAIGAGTAVAVESAGVVLGGNSLTDALAALELGRATRRIIKQNLLWALLYNAVCIPLAAGAFYGLGLLLVPMVASLAMSFSSVFVVCNALRLTRFTPPCLRHKIKSQKENDTMFEKKKTVTTVLTVEGMMCKMCVAHVEKALVAVKGVVQAKADLESKTVTVQATEKVSVEALKKAITEAGYSVQ